MSNKFIAALWVFGGFIGAKIANDFFYPFFNNSSTGISMVRALMPALIAVSILIFGCYKGYIQYKKIDNNEKKNSTDAVNKNIEIPTQSKILVMAVVVLVVLLLATNFDGLKKTLSGEKLYDAYVCINPAVETKEECQRELRFVAKFLVDKSAQQVLLELNKIADGKKSLTTLTNCKINDAKNWKCGDVMKTEVYGLSYDGAYQMINGEMHTTDSFVGKVNIKAMIFKVR